MKFKPAKCGARSLQHLSMTWETCWMHQVSSNIIMGSHCGKPIEQTKKKSLVSCWTLAWDWLQNCNRFGRTSSQETQFFSFVSCTAFISLFSLSFVSLWSISTYNKRLHIAKISLLSENLPHRILLPYRQAHMNLNSCTIVIIKAL